MTGESERGAIEGALKVEAVRHVVKMRQWVERPDREHFVNGECQCECRNCYDEDTNCVCSGCTDKWHDHSYR